MRKLILLLLTLTTLACQASNNLPDENQGLFGGAMLTVAGKTVTAETHHIVVPEQALVQEQHAANQLQYHLRLMTGQELAVVTAAKTSTLKIPLFVGRCSFPSETGLNIEFDKLGSDGIRIITRPDALVFAGNERGVLYAVYVFLEKFCQCHWFAPDCSDIPRSGTIEVPAVDYSYMPPFEMRDCNYKSCFIPEFGVRNRLNGTHNYAPEEWGGRITYAGKRGFSHTFERMVPVEKYYEAHPEYYSQIKNSKIAPQHLQLCLTNSDVKEIVVAEAKKWLLSSPGSKIVSVSHNDRSNYCRCSKCMELAAKEESQTGPLLHFVNYIADALKQEFPDVMVDTLAYGYTWKPPRHVKARDNVIVRLCPIQSCFSHALDRCDYNGLIQSYFEDWCNGAGKVYVWNYSMNYGRPLMPFPNLYAIKPQIEYFLRKGVNGVFYEGNHFSSGGEMAELRAYLIASLLWDPTRDTNALIDNFLEAYYAEAAPYIKKYIDLIHNHAKNKHITISTPPDYFLDHSVMDTAATILEQAEQAVKDDPIRLRRVQTATLPVFYSQLILNTTERRYVNGRLMPVEDNSEELVEKFAKFAKAANVARAERRETPDNWIESIRQRQPEACDAVLLENTFASVLIVPEHGGRIWSIRTASGKEILKNTDTWEGGYEEFCNVSTTSSVVYDTFEGGYRQISDGAGKLLGNSEKYEVLNKTANSLTLQGDLGNGLQLTRKIILLPDTPGLKITSTLRNCSGKTQEVGLNMKPVFRVSDSAQSAVMAQSADGNWQLISLSLPSDQRWGREIVLSDEQSSAGSWALFDKSESFAVENDFSTTNLKHCRINWSGAQAWAVLQLEYGTELNPDDSVTVESSYRFIFTDFPWQK